MNTSNEAYTAIKPVLPSLREQVYEVIKNAGAEGAIAEDLINTILPNTYLAGGSLNSRPIELARAGRVALKRNADGTIAVRKNSRGRSQQIWVATNV